MWITMLTIVAWVLGVVASLALLLRMAEFIQRPNSSGDLFRPFMFALLCWAFLIAKCSHY